MSNIEQRDAFLSYRTVWRWHFYAGLFAIPFIIFLSITGSLYLFRPQVETWLDRPFDTMATAQTAPPSQVVDVVLAQNPGWMLRGYQLPRGDHSAAQVILTRKGVERRFYVDRSDLRILKTVGEEDRPMRVLFWLHGELLSGKRGSNLVELAASWGIIMILTGLYLWWPRNVTGLGGVLYPRLGRGSRTVLRDIHAVTGLWVSIFALGFLMSGLPWANNWGHYLKAVRGLTGAVAITQNWTTGSADERQAREARDVSAQHAMAMGDHAMHDMPGMVMAGDGAMMVPPGLDTVFAVAQRLDLAAPVVLTPATDGSAIWTAASQTQNRPHRATVRLDGLTGHVVSRTDFSQLYWLDRLIGFTTAAHEGQLFGWFNTLLNLALAISLITVCVSAVVMWWRRRAPDSLGAPVAQRAAAWSWGLGLVVLLLGVLLPEFLASLLLVLAVEYMVLRRWPRARDWLGLTAR